jgi:replicative DNA helicase
VTAEYIPAEFEPRHSEEAERALLGSAFRSTIAARWLAAKIPPEAFYRPAHRKIAEAIHALVRLDFGFEDDAPQVIQTYLQNEGDPKDVGGLEYLRQIDQYMPSGANVRHFGEQVLTHYQMRTYQERAAKLWNVAQNGRPDKAHELAFGIGRNVVGIGTDTLRSSEIDIDDQNEQVRGVTTGIYPVDQACQGFGYYSGEVSVIVGKRGTGKTAWMVNSAIAAARAGNRVGYVTLEMPAVAIQRRMVQSLCGWSKRPDFSLQELADYDEAKKQVEGWDVSFYQHTKRKNGDRTVESVCAWAMEVKDTLGLGVLFVDYAQKLQTARKMENRTRELDYIADELDDLAKRIDCPVIVGSQASEVPGSKEWRTKDSIKFEDNAALVLYVQRDPQDWTKATAKIGKNRHGEDGIKFPLTFNGRFVRYECWEEDPYAEP